MEARIMLDLPESVFERLEETIKKTIEESLKAHSEKLLATPRKLTRKEAAAKLRISLPTLDKLEKEGRLMPERAGKRVLYDEGKLEIFLTTR